MNTQWKLVPIELFVEAMKYCDPPEIEVDGVRRRFVNPYAAEALHHLSNAVRAMIAAAPDAPHVIGPARPDASVTITWDEQGEPIVRANYIHVDAVGMDDMHVAIGLAIARLVLEETEKSKGCLVAQDADGLYNTVQGVL